MSVSQEGPANALHLSCNRSFDQVSKGTSTNDVIYERSLILIQFWSYSI